MVSSCRIRARRTLDRVRAPDSSTADRVGGRVGVATAAATARGEEAGACIHGDRAALAERSCGGGGVDRPRGGPSTTTSGRPRQADAGGMRRWAKGESACEVRERKEECEDKKKNTPSLFCTLISHLRLHRHLHPIPPFSHAPAHSHPSLSLSPSPISSLLGTPGRRVLEQAQPGPRARRVDARVGGGPGALPPQEAALRVGHHRQVAAVGRAERGDAVGRAVGVGRVGGGDGPRRVRVPDGGQAALKDRRLDARVRERGPALPVRAPDADRRARHALQQHGRRVQDRDLGPPGLKPPGRVVREPGLGRHGGLRERGGGEEGAGAEAGAGAPPGTHPSRAISWHPLHTPSDQVSGRARKASKAAAREGDPRMAPAHPFAESRTSA